jgi:hypothetical protein
MNCITTARCVKSICKKRTGNSSERPCLWWCHFWPEFYRFPMGNINVSASCAQHAHAVDRLRRASAAAEAQTVRRLLQAQLPPADLIYAGLSLPYCAPQHFVIAWRGETLAQVRGDRAQSQLRSREKCASTAKSGVAVLHRAYRFAASGSIYRFSSMQTIDCAIIRLVIPTSSHTYPARCYQRVPTRMFAPRIFGSVRSQGGDE